MSPKIKVEEILKRRVTNREFLNAATYMENKVGLLINERSPDAVIRVLAKHIKEFDPSILSVEGVASQGGYHATL